MGLALFKERRLSDRRRLTGLLPGRLVFGEGLEGQKELICRPVDVSINGMGIVVVDQKKPIDPGTEMMLILKDGPIRLQVTWGHPDFGKQDLYRYGLVTIEPEQNLEEVFIRTGCLR